MKQTAVARRVETTILNSEAWKGEDTTVELVTQLAREVELDLQIQGLIDQPFLGLATTSQLLTELAARMESTQNSTAGRELGKLCREALQNLSLSVLAYRTVTS